MKRTVRGKMSESQCRKGGIREGRRHWLGALGREQQPFFQCRVHPGLKVAPLALKDSCED